MWIVYFNQQIFCSKILLVNGQKYAENFELQITRTVRDHNTRGNIYDCNGEALAGIGMGEGWDRVYTGGEAFSHILGYTG